MYKQPLRSVASHASERSGRSKQISRKIPQFFTEPSLLSLRPTVIFRSVVGEEIGLARTAERKRASLYDLPIEKIHGEGTMMSKSIRRIVITAFRHRRFAITGASPERPTHTSATDFDENLVAEI